MNTPHQQRIEEMMGLMGQSVPTEPTIPDESTRLLRAKLIMEECLETIEALGFYPCLVGIDSHGDREEYSLDEYKMSFPAYGSPDLTEIADGCADISVVTIGTLSACGIKDQPILETVDENNLTKFGEGSYRRDDGKWMKPPDFVGPDLVGCLDDQR